MKNLTLATLLALSLTACLKDKSAEEAPVEQTEEQAAAPTEGTPAEAVPTEAAPPETK